MSYVMDDGGRQAAGFRDSAGDCACRAIAIATGMSYRSAYALITQVAAGEKFKRGKVGFRAATGRGSSARDGVLMPTMRDIMDTLGWTWTATMLPGTGCKVHLRADELPAGRIIARVSRHFVAVVDGIVHDTHDSTRAGARCVYGYWSLPT